MARQRRTLERALLDLSNQSRSISTVALTTPSLTAITTDLIADGAVQKSKLDADLTAALDDNATQIDSLNSQLATELPALDTRITANATAVTQAQSDVADATTAANTAQASADAAQSVATSVNTLVQGWTTTGTTTIDGGQLTTDSITAAKLVAGTLTSASGVFGSIDASVIDAGTLNVARLNAGDLRTAVLSAGKITAADIVAGTITGNEIAANAITATKILAGSIQTAHMAVGTINGDRITANTIAASHLMATAIDGKTITGATIQTAATGARLVLDATGLNGWDASNVNYLTANSGGLTMIGTVKAKGLTDSTTPSGLTATVGATLYPGINRSVPGFAFVTDVPQGTPAGIFSSEGTSITLQSGNSNGAGSGGVVGAQVVLSGQNVKINATQGVDFVNGNSGKVNLRNIGDATITTINSFPTQVQFDEYPVNGQTGVPSATVWGPGKPAQSVGVQVTARLGNWNTNDVFTITNTGYYAFHWGINFAAGPVNGRSFVSIEPQSGWAFGRSSISPGEDTGQAAIPCLYLPAGTAVIFHFYHTSAGTQTVNHDIRIHRLA